MKLLAGAVLRQRCSQEIRPLLSDFPQRVAVCFQLAGSPFPGVRCQPGQLTVRLRENAVPAPSVGIALSERRSRADFDPVQPGSQEEISEFIEPGRGLFGFHRSAGRTRRAPAVCLNCARQRRDSPTKIVWSKEAQNFCSAWRRTALFCCVWN